MDEVAGLSKAGVAAGLLSLEALDGDVRVLLQVLRGGFLSEAPHVEVELRVDGPFSER